MPRIAVTALAVVLAWLPVQVAAAQDDARLEYLFSRLHGTADRTEAKAIEIVIWNIWTLHGDETVDGEMRRGIEAMSAGHLPAAVEAFDTVIALDPDHAEGWNKRATAYYYMGRFDDSVRDIGRTLALEPRHFGALSGLGMIFLDLGREHAALEVFERAQAIHPHLAAVNARIQALREKLNGKVI